MRRVIEDPDSRQQPLKILEQKVSVFKEPEHAQIHANARNQPATSCMLISGFAHLTAKPKIHRGGPEQERSEGRVPGAITTKVSELKSMSKIRSNYLVESAERVTRAILRQMFRGSGAI